jgi:hypothetical protein
VRKRSIKGWVLALAGLMVTAWVLPARAEVTDEEVRRAIEKGREYLISLGQPDGSFVAGAGGMKGCYSAIVFMTLAYMGEHPNREVMAKGLDYLLNLNIESNFNDRQGYAGPIRVMGLSYIHNKLLGDRRTAVRQKMLEDLMQFQLGQSPSGGWRYKLNAADYDFSVTQWPILAMREASLVGIEFLPEPLKKARELYYKFQQSDGGWCYTGDKTASYGSMTAAGLASVFIITDVLEPSSGCPCKNGESQAKAVESERRIDKALAWLGKHYTAQENPGKGGRSLYWLYCVERVGIAAGYKYFGNHNWYKEGAEILLKAQKDGHWGDIPDTCFALLFLYKGRAPVLYNKLKFDGEWNAHRRDIANLTTHIERTKEQQFHWQILELKAPLEELHDAPVLYICAESVPKWTDADKKKLRQFTDTGGTVLFEASCGNAVVRKWFPDFAREIWPEWKIERLAQEHGVWQAPYPMKEKPEVLGISDGIRTPVFYSPDDISCAWQTKALAAKQYLFNWGINLYTYATDGAPLRAKLAGREPEKTNRFAQPVKAGPKTTLKVARVKHGGNWEAGANYGGFKLLADHLKAKANITLEVKESNQAPVTDGGVAPADLGGYDVAFLTGTALSLRPEEREALKAYADKGGFLWFEAADGSAEFDQGLRQLAQEIKWELKLLPNTHPLMNGRMEPGLAYNLTTGIEFRQSMRVQRLGRNYAEFYGVFDADKLLGVYSPLDTLFCITGYEAYKCRGYKAEDAAAADTNLAVYLSTLK